MLTPITAITISYVLGILLSRALTIPIQLLLLAAVSSLISAIVLSFRGQKPSYLIICMVILLGMIAFRFSDAVAQNDVSRFAGDRFVKIIGNIADEPSTSDDLCRFTLRVKKIVIRGQSHDISGSAGIYIKGRKPFLYYGNKVEVFGKLSKNVSTSNPGVASFGDLMEKRHILCQMFSDGSGVGVIQRSTGSPIRYMAIIIKDHLISVIRDSMDEPYSSLLGSIVFGSQASPLPDDLQDNYRTAGVIHLLVVSGTQVSIIMASILSLCGAFGLSRNTKFVSVTFANMLFTVMVGAGPSIVRAAVMCEAALIAKTFERENDFYNSLSISALVLLMLRPLDLFDVGFQLSFMATWALFYLAPAIEEKIAGHVPDYLRGPMAMSVAPTVATTPLILYNFGQVSFVSVISNFMIVPWVEITVMLGFLSTLLGLVFLPLAYAINNTLTIMLALLNGIVNVFSGLPFACRYFPPPGLFTISLYYIMLIGGIEAMKGRINIKPAKAALILIILLCAAMFSWSSSHAAGDLTVTVVDVGQGDSILIESPSGYKALIDGGGRQENVSPRSIKKEDPVGKSIIVPFLRKKGMNELDLVVLTHPHDDHVAGLPYVLEKIKVNMVLDSGQPHTSRGYSRFLKAIQKKKIPYKIARAGQAIDLGGGVKGYVLHPSEPLISGTESDLNNNSVVIKIDYGRTSFLLMGDAAFEAEERMLSSGYSLRSNVLKVGHHGSRTSTSIRLLENAVPEYAVISAGAKNKFGHPSEDTLRRLNNYGIKVLRTDMSGAVIFKSNGVKVRLQ